MKCVNECEMAYCVMCLVLSLLKYTRSHLFALPLSGASTNHIQILTNNHIFHSCDAMAWSTCCHNVVAASYKNRKATHWTRKWNERAEKKETQHKGQRWNDARDIIKIPRDFFFASCILCERSSWVWTTDISGGNQWSQPIHIHIHIYYFAAIEIVI